MVDPQRPNNLLLALPPALEGFERLTLAPLDRASGKRGVTAAYIGRSFSAIIAAWHPGQALSCIEDGIGRAVAAQFAIDVYSTSAQEAIAPVVQATAFLCASGVRVPILEARYLIQGVADEPAFSTCAALGLCGYYVNIMTTVAGPESASTSNRLAFAKALARRWEHLICVSPAALSSDSLRTQLQDSLPSHGPAWTPMVGNTDLDEWLKIRAAVASLRKP